MDRGPAERDEPEGRSDENRASSRILDERPGGRRARPAGGPTGAAPPRCPRALLLALVALLLLGGCVMVRPEEREYLADPAMTFGSEGVAAAQEAHVLSNREGSSGGGQVTGGGCGCN